MDYKIIQNLRQFEFFPHDLRVIRFLSDQVYVMKDGIIVEHGSSDEVFEEPKHNYTKELLAASIS